MKKICNVLVLALVLVGLFTFTCNVASAETSSKTDSSDMQMEYSFPTISELTDDEVLKTYWNEVYEKVWKKGLDGSFLTADEYKYLTANDFHIYDFEGQYIGKYDTKSGTLSKGFFPVVFESENGIELWCTDDDGDLRREAIEGELTNNYTWDLINDAHHILGEYEDILIKSPYFETVYDCTTGSVSVWEFGKKVREHFVPKYSIYAGLSGMEGYIFRKENDVYAVRDNMNWKRSVDGVEVIAHNVEFVIDADYEADDPNEFSQPLFWMKDGTVMFYCTFYSDVGIPVDDERHLIQVRFERGFNL